MHLKELDILGRFSTILYKEDNFCNFPVHQDPSEKDSTLKRKKGGANSFFFTVESFLKGMQKQFWEDAVPECVSITLNLCHAEEIILKDAIPTSNLFVLRFYGPVNPMGSCRVRSVYLATRLLGRLSPLSS